MQPGSDHTFTAKRHELTAHSLPTAACAAAIALLFASLLQPEAYTAPASPVARSSLYIVDYPLFPTSQPAGVSISFGQDEQGGPPCGAEKLSRRLHESLPRLVHTLMYTTSSVYSDHYISTIERTSVQ